MKYYPFIHDFISTDKNIILFDFPLFLNYTNFFYDRNILPISLDNKNPTYIYILDKNNNNNYQTYTIDNSIYIFHFADYYEDDQFIEIYASIYDKLDFSSFNLDGRYRRIKINKVTKKIDIDKNIELENMNLDFPIKFDNKVILQSSTDEFVICEKLNIIKKIKIPKGNINGEHRIIKIDKISYLFCFTSYKELSSIIMINLINYSIIDIPINENLNIGFHSIYIENKDK